MEAAESSATPGTSYMPTVSPIAASALNPSVSRTFATDETRTPTNLEGERVGSTGILLSWIMPPDSNGGHIISYTVKYKEVCPYPDSAFMQMATHSEIPEFLLNTLTPGSTYNIKIGFAFTELLSNVVQTTNQRTTPGLVTNLTAFAYNHSFVKVTWFLPKRTNGLITKFSVKAKHARTGQTVRILELNAEDIMNGAIPHCNTLYSDIDSTSVCVTQDAAEILSRGTPSPLDASMLTSASSPPITLSAAPPAASWSVPISVGVDQLRPYTAYVFEVSAFTSDGEGQIASYMVRMPESATSWRISSAAGVHGKVPPGCLFALSLCWHDCAIAAIQYACATMASNGQQGMIQNGWEPPSPTHSETKLGISMALPPYQTHSHPPNLREEEVPGMQWGCVQGAVERIARMVLATVAMPWISLRLSLLLTLTAAFAHIALQPAPEDPPENLAVWNITSKSFTLSWDAPSIVTGRFSYFIELHGPSGFMFENSTADTRLMYSGLTPFTNYRVVIRARSAGALGPEAETTVLTPAEAPSAVSELKAIAIDSTSVKLSWRSPRQPNGLITQYKILVLTHDALVQDITLIGPEEESDFVKGSLLMRARRDTFFPTTTSMPASQVPHLLLLTTSLTSRPISDKEEHSILQTDSTPTRTPVTYALSLTSTTPGSPPSWLTDTITPRLFSSTDPGTPVAKAGSGKMPLGPSPNTVPTGLGAGFPSTLSQDVGVQLVSLSPSPAQPRLSTRSAVTSFSTEVTTSTREVIDVSADHLSYVVQNLNPFTEYTFTVSAFTGVGEGPPVKIREKTREQVPSAVQSVSYQNISTTSILLSWEPPLNPNGLITHYTVYVLDLGSQEAFQRVMNKTSILLTVAVCFDSVAEFNKLWKLNITPRLKKYTKYKVRVAASTAAGESALSEEDDVFVVTQEDVLNPRGTLCKTGCVDTVERSLMGQQMFLMHSSLCFLEPDSPPVNLAVFNITASAATVTWSPPEKPNGIIQFYEIFYQNLTFSDVINTSTTSVTFRHLKPSSVYNVTVRAYTKHGHGDQTSAILEMLTGEDVPGSPPFNLTYKSISSSEVMVSWQAPVHPNGVILFYTVEYWNATHYMNVSTPVASVHLSNLRKYARYSMTVRASTRQGSGDQVSEVLNITTLEDVPSSPPRFLFARRLSDNQIELSWTPPLEANAPVLYYPVRVWNLTSEYRENVTDTFVVISVDGEGLYNASVSSWTRFGDGGMLVYITFSTVITGPADPPQNISYISLTPSSLQVMWYPPRQPNGAVLFYTIHYSNSSSIYTQRVPVSQPQPSDAPLSFVMENLAKGSNYSLWMSANTAQGDGGVQSDMIHVLTPEDVPDGPIRNLTAQNFTSTAIIVSWDPPISPNGRVFYLLSLKVLHDESGNTTNKSTTDTVFLFTKLFKYTDYVLRVTPATSAGHSESSTTVLYLRTEDDFPSSPPVMGSSKNVTASSIYLSWHPPVEPNGVITEYTVAVQSQDGSDTTVTPNTSLVLTGLIPFSPYNVSIAAVNRRGMGPPLTLLLHTDEAGPASPPRNLSILNHTADSVWLAWQPSLEPNGVVQFYGFKILELSRQTLSHQNSSGPTTQTMLTGFRPHSIYQISVSTFTKVGNGNQYSNPVILTTNESASDAVRNLTCHGSRWDSVFLKWDPPAHPNGEITHYLLQFGDQERVLAAAAWQHTITGLQANTKYTLRLMAVNAAGPGEDQNCTVTTSREAEEVPGHLREYHVEVQLLAPGCDDWFATHCVETQQLVYEATEAWGSQEVTIDSLIKYTRYRFRVRARTNAGYGNASDWVSVLTLPGKPDAPPRDVSALPSSNSLKIQWKAPEVLSGPTSYLIDIIPEDGLGVNLTVVRRHEEITTVVVSNLTAFTLYSVTVTAFTGDVADARKDGKASDTVHVRTLEDEPKDPPRNVTLQLIPEDVTRVYLSFSPPDNPNGKIIAYKAMVYKGGDLDFQIQSLDIIERSNNTFTAVIDGLKGGYNYSIRVCVFTVACSSPPKPNKKPVVALYPSGAPMVTARTITTQMPTCYFTDQHGPIEKVQVIVAEFRVRNSNLTNWYNAYYNSPAPYITDDGFSNPECLDGVARKDLNSKRYTIGAKNDCLSQENALCNGPLKPKTHYVFKFRATNTLGQYTDSEYSDPVKTSDDRLLTRDEEIILGVLLSFFLAIFLIVVIYTSVRIHQKQKEGGTYSPREAEIIDTKLKLDQLIAVADLELKEEKLNRYTQLILSPCTYRPINKKSFLQHVEDLCANDNAKFQEEFSELPKVLQDLATSDADLPWNRSKNRFTNIKPYNNNRVKLLSEPGVPGSDYINASFVSGYLCPNEFIATQGPLPGTVGDFWRMIWETRSRTIVMLTQCFEKGRIRCHQYWPEDNKPVTVFGDIIITKLAEDVFPDWTVRVLKVERHGNYMVVNHFNFTSWPEHGVPESSATLIQFVKAIRANRGRDSSNIVVHCSAGVGRTGVFIALDHLVQHVRDHDFVDVYGLVAELRSERMCMVQNLAQYMFLHQSTLDLLSSKGNSQSIWFVNYSALEKMDSLDAMEGDVELEWEETTM
ncbi:phosphatidylinositol phosphatase PTPRQ-like [Scleropages formosus]|uniref:Phosphatidylinositol phosphatase PTPRQ-like n=1 Tax=Scleropages formosus TaxID=113540 RepID=A0A0P7V9R6_SCLFO|nr:phosphatidylinositol phosphatase PTPRQ-like [Scleropages formosus]